MEVYINSILTLILIGIYLFNTKAQNQKIKAQSEIINDLRDHVKFFDLQKIKEYVELRETQKDKLLELTKQTIEQEFEIKSKNTNSIKEIEVPQNEFASNWFLDTERISEAYVFIVKELIFKSPDELERILTTYFPKNREFILKNLENAKVTMMKHFKVSSFEEITDRLKIASFDQAVLEKSNGG